ncbi:hypothetical protein Pint_16689 [Pistacia integerrima]|nr:hypothetical protein Pint_16689 [Pistacia integerrima]
MKVTEKCDVYSFGVLAMEVIQGKHPRDFLSQISDSSANMNIERLVICWIQGFRFPPWKFKTN